MDKRAKLTFFLSAALMVAAVMIFFSFFQISLEKKEPEAPSSGEVETEAFPIDGTLSPRTSVELTPVSEGRLGDAAYLVSSDFALNEGNLEASLLSFFGAPCSLDFYLEDGNTSGIFRCDDAAAKDAFGAAITAADFRVISMRKYDAAVAAGSIANPYHEASYRRAYFANEIGQVSLIVGKDGTYLDFYRHLTGSAEKTESGRTFFTKTDLYDGLLAVKAEMGEVCESLD